MASNSEVNEVYRSFPNIIGIVYNNWTALKIAVDHGLGGNPSVTERKLNALVDVVSEALKSGRNEWYDIADLLYDLMDSEFCTLLEDNSHEYIAVHITLLYKLFCSGDLHALQEDIRSFTNTSPIHCNSAVQRIFSEADTVEDPKEEELPQEHDSSLDDGWMLVRRK